MPRAEKEDANEFHVDFEENTRIIPQDVNFMTVYDYGGEDPLVFPMHEDCYELLGKVAKPRKIDTAALYQVFTAHLPPPSHGSPNALDFDYGPAKEYQSKSWPNAQGIGYAVIITRFYSRRPGHRHHRKCPEESSQVDCTRNRATPKRTNWTSC
ncbi:hypothetical protein NW761_002823 [Fusarium oxysporum]|uniref:Uncharacterized protein n=1 Tax=Fusarium oxysporum f. sp. pisi HDV247 TaxID=1080344 RepID=W9PD79_FUSOX|nr:hypothetical protein FOVG_08076 [Fusarium oxysporum f. sp. pisi HDV247]KAJ4099855.1 hypothetical protein NW761_002823 [Fusarium oxysporum]KAJ4242177.1 hypothetical protein NW760_000387 [Fusarium oxysporum]